MIGKQSHQTGRSRVVRRFRGRVIDILPVDPLRLYPGAQALDEDVPPLLSLLSSLPKLRDRSLGVACSIKDLPEINAVGLVAVGHVGKLRRAVR